MEEAETFKSHALVNKQEIEEEAKLAALRLQTQEEERVRINKISEMILEAEKLRSDQNLAVSAQESQIRINELQKQMESIQPKLIEAIITLGSNETTKILAQNIKQQGGDWTDIFRKGGTEGMLQAVKGTPLYDKLIELFQLNNDN
jgi:hypothetical protein